MYNSYVANLIKKFFSAKSELLIKDLIEYDRETQDLKYKNKIII